jgi:hypothetical protein
MVASIIPNGPSKTPNVLLMGCSLATNARHYHLGNINYRLIRVPQMTARWAVHLGAYLKFAQNWLIVRPANPLIGMIAGSGLSL